jgi:26S proteasome regulatory subunit N1
VARAHKHVVRAYARARARAHARSGSHAAPCAGDAASFEDLLPLVRDIVPFHMAHNAEPEAVDLLIETERLDLLLEHCDRCGCPARVRGA